MDSQRAQILQRTHAKSYLSTVYQCVAVLIKGSQWTQNIITKGLNEGKTSGVTKGMTNKP